MGVGIGVDGCPTFVRYRNPCPMNHAAKSHPLAGRIVRHLLVRNSCDEIKREDSMAYFAGRRFALIDRMGTMRGAYFRQPMRQTLRCLIGCCYWESKASNSAAGFGRSEETEDIIAAQPIKRCVLLISQLKLIVAAALCHLCLLQETAWWLASAGAARAQNPGDCRCAQSSFAVTVPAPHESPRCGFEDYDFGLPHHGGRVLRDPRKNSVKYRTESGSPVPCRMIPSKVVSAPRE